MLDYYSVPAILIGLAVLSFPCGYITMNTIRKGMNTSFPFFILLPTYLAVGLSIVFLISISIPFLVVSPYVLVVTTIIGYIFAIRIFNSTRVIKKGDFNIQILLTNYFKLKLSGSRRQAFPSIASLCVIAAMFIIVSSSVVVGYSWPHAGGNALIDLFLTALAVDQTYLTNDILSSTIPFSYPVGYDLVSANISILFNVYPAEAVFVLGAFILLVISCSLFSLTFILTHSVWFSLPAVFTIFAIWGLLAPENSVNGLDLALPYPAVFGLMSIISLILQLQLIQSYHSNPSIWKSLPLAVITVISTYVTFPQFLVFEAIIIVTYYALIITPYKAILSSRISYISRFIDYFRLPYTGHSQKSKRLINATEGPELAHNGTFLTKNMHELNPTNTQNLFNIIASLIIIGIFGISFSASGLASYYGNISMVADPVYIEGTSIISNLAVPISQPLEKLLPLGSNPYVLSLISVALVTSVLAMVVIQKAMPLLIVFIAFFISMLLSSLNVVGLISTVSSIVALSFAVIAFSVWKILGLKARSSSRSIGQNNSITNSAADSINKKEIFVTATFVSLSFLALVPLIANFTLVTEGRTSPNMDLFYDIGMWLKANVSGDDRILNDRSLAGYYLDGFSLMNVTYSYPTALTHSEQMPNAEDSSKEQTMNEELDVVIWQNPNRPELIYPVLSYYNISHIVLLSELRSSLFGAEGQMNKPFSNEIYTRYFDSYDFLQSNFSSGLSRIYHVN